MPKPQQVVSLYIYAGGDIGVSVRKPVDGKWDGPMQDWGMKYFSPKQIVIISEFIYGYLKNTDFEGLVKEEALEPPSYEALD